MSSGRRFVCKSINGVPEKIDRIFTSDNMLQLVENLQIANGRLPAVYILQSVLSNNVSPVLRIPSIQYVLVSRIRKFEQPVCNVMVPVHSLLKGHDPDRYVGLLF